MRSDHRHNRLWSLGAVAACLAAAIGLTFPLVTRFSSWFPSGPEDQDVFLFLWNNWWVHHTVVALHTKPYITNFIYAPFVTDLRFTSSGLLYGFLSIPLVDRLSPAAVLNVQVITTIVLNGYAAFVLTRRLCGRDDAAFTAALLLASTPAVNFHLALGRPSCAAVWPMILMIHWFLRLLEKPDNRTAVGFGLFSVATLVGDQEAALFGAGWLAVLIAYESCSRNRRRLIEKASVARLLVVAIVAAAPAYVLYVKPFLTTTGYTTPSPAEALRYSFPVSLIWSPELIWKVYGQLLPLGMLGAIGSRGGRRPIAPWLIGTALFVILSFGPVVTGTDIPLPFSLLRRLPGLEQFRTPYRFQIAAALGMTVMTASMLASWLSSARATSRIAIVLIATALIAADLSWRRVTTGFPLQTMDAHAVYDVIRQDPRDCVVLEVPVGIRTGTDRIGPGEALSFYQQTHQKRLISGSTSRMPVAALNYYRSSPAIMFLAAEQAPAGDLLSDLQRRIRELRIGYVVVHPKLLDPARLAAILDLLGRMDDVQRLSPDDELIAFRVSEPGR